MLELNGNWALITGATSGMGYKVAKDLAHKGHNMVLVGCNEERLCNLARELNEISDIIIMQVDLNKEGASAEIFHECDRLGLKINVMFNFPQENN